MQVSRNVMCHLILKQRISFLGVGTPPKCQFLWIENGWSQSLTVLLETQLGNGKRLGCKTTRTIQILIHY